MTWQHWYLRFRKSKSAIERIMNFGIYRPGSSIKAPSTHVISDSDDRPQAQQLSDFMLQLEDYTSTVPDAVTAHYLNMAGFEANDPRIVRLISVATQKFISDVANDALVHCKTRTNNIQASQKDKKLNNKDRKYTLTMDDLTPALADHGITVRKPQYYP